MFPVAIAMHLKLLNIVLGVRMFDSEHIFLTFLCLFYFILFFLVIFKLHPLFNGSTKSG